MAREEQVKQWFDIAEQDMQVAELTHKNSYWLYTAFLCHQALEKALKGYWTAVRDDIPLYTHSHAKLMEECGLMAKLTDEQLKFVAMMIPMYIEARYPSYKQKVAGTLNEQISQHILDETKQMIQWIKEQL